MAKKLGTFGQLLKQTQVDAALRGCEQGDLQAFAVVKDNGRLDKFDKSQRLKAAAAFYARSKRYLGARDFENASRAMGAAAEFAPEDRLVRERAALLRDAASRRDPIRCSVSVHEMQRTLQSICTKTPCVCRSHFQVAVCREIIDRGYPQRVPLRGIPVHTMGLYHAYQRRGAWTKLLKAVKERHEPQWLEVLADIVADYLIEEGGVIGTADVLVPIPADPNKYVKRGFAPNDVLAEHLSRRVGLLVYPSLVRTPGESTREATEEELAAEFRVEERYGIPLRGLYVALIEDIWTWGRTIPICAAKIRQATQREVVAVALAKATH